MFAFKKKGNCNIMKSYNQLRDISNLIGTILYHNLSWGWPFINHLLPDLPNLLGQLNLLN